VGRNPHPQRQNAIERARKLLKIDRAGRRANSMGEGLIMRNRNGPWGCDVERG